MASAASISEFPIAPEELSALPGAGCITTETAGDCDQSFSTPADAAGLNGGEWNRNEAVLAHLQEVRALASRIHRRLPSHIELEDLVQAGMLGLLDAVERFDPTRRLSAGQYIRIRVTGAIFDSLRGQDWVSRYMRTRQQKLRSATERAQKKLGRSVSAEDIAEELNMDLDSYFEFAAAVQELRKIESNPIPEHDEVPDTAELLPASEDARPDFEFFKQETREVMARILQTLPRDEQQVLRLYYFEEWTMREIASRIHRTESRVSQIHAKALRHLAARLDSHPRRHEQPDHRSNRATGVTRAH